MAQVIVLLTTNRLVLEIHSRKRRAVSQLKSNRRCLQVRSKSGWAKSMKAKYHKVSEQPTFASLGQKWTGTLILSQTTRKINSSQTTSFYRSAHRQITFWWKVTFPPSLLMAFWLLLINKIRRRMRRLQQTCRRSLRNLRNCSSWMRKNGWLVLSNWATLKSWTRPMNNRRQTCNGWQHRPTSRGTPSLPIREARTTKWICPIYSSREEMKVLLLEIWMAPINKQRSQNKRRQCLKLECRNCLSSSVMKLWLFMILNWISKICDLIKISGSKVLGLVNK